MSKTIKLNSEISIDLDKLIDTRLLVQANSGGGKSWLLRRILEQSHGKVQQIVIDLEGEFQTLREKYDYILASKDGDIPAEPRSAELLARKILELNVSAIVDLYELNHYDRKRFVRLFLDALVNAPKKLWHPAFVVVDEAHVFCPEKGQAESSGSVIDLATRGRKRGFCAILATQRLSKLHKDAAAECNNKLIGRTGLDIDMKRASDELGFRTKEDYLSLRNLESGEFFAFGPALSTEIIKVRIGDVQTTHPKAGSRMLSAQPAPPTSKIKNLLSKLKDLPEAAKKEAKTIADFKKQLTETKTELRVLKATNTKATRNIPASQEQIDKAVNQALRIKEGEMFKERGEMKKAIENLLTVIQKISQTSLNAIAKAGPFPKDHRPTVPKVVVTTPVTGGNATADVGVSDNRLTGGALRMVEILVSKYPMTFTKAQLATFAKLSPRSGTYGTYLSRIRGLELISEEGNQIKASEKALREHDVTQDVPQTSEEIIKMWRSKFNGGAKRMFDVLIENYPFNVTKEELGVRANLESTSGTFGTYLSRLRSNGLIEVSSEGVIASENLFI